MPETWEPTGLAVFRYKHPTQEGALVTMQVKEMPNSIV